MQGVDVATGRNDVTGQLNGLTHEAILRHRDGRASGNAPQQRHLNQIGGSAHRLQTLGEAYAARHGAFAYDMTFLLQGVQVVIHYRSRRYIHRFADLPNGGGIPTVQGKALDELQNFALSFR